MNLTVNFSEPIGPVRPLHQVGQPPFAGSSTSHFRDLTEANVKYCRLHDTGGAYGMNRFVDIPNIFRNFDADENDPASYDFAFTDWLLTAMNKAGLEPIYRLGVSIENMHNIRNYYLDPPKDFGKWARICEHIVRHYNEGWADGFHFGVRFWEIWEEPDNGENAFYNNLWSGTPEQYFELYDVTAKHLKACFGDSISVGGYGGCGFYDASACPEKYGLQAELSEEDRGMKGLRPARSEHFMKFFDDFLAYIRASGAPMDFFSWHSYATVEATLVMADYAQKKLEEYGFGDVFQMINEWNNMHSRKIWATDEAAAKFAAMLLGLHKKKSVDMMCFYDARIGHSEYGGLYHPLTQEPTGAYYALKAFGRLYGLGTEYALSAPEKYVYALAAGNEEEKAVMLTNISAEKKQVRTNLAGFRVYRVGQDAKISLCEKNAEEFELDRFETLLIVR